MSILALPQKKEPHFKSQMEKVNLEQNARILALEENLKEKEQVITRLKWQNETYEKKIQEKTATIRTLDANLMEKDQIIANMMWESCSKKISSKSNIQHASIVRVQAEGRPPPPKYCPTNGRILDFRNFSESLIMSAKSEKKSYHPPHAPPISKSKRPPWK